MLEISFIVAVVAGAALVVGRLRRQDTTLFDDSYDVVDLPCPWCQAATREDDTACPSCDHPFGVAET